MKIGITGHQELEDPNWVMGEIRKVLDAHQPIIAFSSLAVGADQLFALAVIESHGELNVILPMEDYEEKFAPQERTDYHSLLSKSHSVKVLKTVGSDEECYLAAGKKIVELCDLLVAVWNGKPAKGKGGTGDIVEFAMKKHRNIIHIDTVKRSSSQLSDESIYIA